MPSWTSGRRNAGRPPAEWPFVSRHALAVTSTRSSYTVLIAMEEVGDQPVLTGSRPVRRGPGVRWYSISHGRAHLPPGQRVRNPVHQLVYRIPYNDPVEILAIIGDGYPAT